MFINKLVLKLPVLLTSHGFFEIECGNKGEAALLVVSHYQLSYSFIYVFVCATFKSSYPMSGSLVSNGHIVMIQKILTLTL